ncbi:MAG TPA: TIGR03618 family F420-dependent PPOX class oxidoreductase [Candidatus Dormibacteraeota bacterium]|nr:TIGR03618 family F420-dependent PPOX class oxidoreductase [Candidatus Dormibacteraeota bacterium]
MTDGEVAEFLAAQRKLHVATLNRDGSPHLVPMYFALVDGAVAFWTYTRSQKIRNLQRDPRITVMAESGEAYLDLRGVQISGVGRLTADPAAVGAFGERLYERQYGALDDGARAYVARSAGKRTVVTVEPRRVGSWDHSKL